MVRNGPAEFWEGCNLGGRRSKCLSIISISPRFLQGLPEGMSSSAFNLPTRIACPACGGQVKIPAGQTRQHLHCPRCEATLFPDESPEPGGSDAPPEAPEDDEYRLSDVVQRPQSVEIHEQWLVDAERDPVREREAPGDDRPAKRPLGDVLANAARECLGRAEAEIQQAEQEAAGYVIRPLFSGLFSFLWDLSAAGRLIVLTLITKGCLSCLLLFLSLSDGGLYGQIAAIVAGIFTALLGLSYLALASVCWLAIVQDTANGMDKIQQWPGPNFLDWMLDSFYLVNGLFVSAVPGILLGYLLSDGGTGGSWVATLLGTVIAFGLFPVLLLSALDTGTPWGLWSRTVVESLIRHKAITIQFFLGSAALVPVGLVFLMFMVQPWLLVSLFGAAGLNATAMIYFRLLGRLTGLLGLDQQDHTAR